jgi:glutamate-1-semialdehyde aminotransferase
MYRETARGFTSGGRVALPRYMRRMIVVMAEFNDRWTFGVSVGGTFNGNPLSLAAALATLTELSRNEGVEPARGLNRALGTRTALWLPD